jgi:hypothetical protein
MYTSHRDDRIREGERGSRYGKKPLFFFHALTLHIITFKINSAAIKYFLPIIGTGLNNEECGERN